MRVFVSLIGAPSWFRPSNEPWWGGSATLQMAEMRTKMANAQKVSIVRLDLR